MTPAIDLDPELAAALEEFTAIKKLREKHLEDLHKKAAAGGALYFI